MRFTEHEMTVAFEAVARRGFEAVPKLLRRRLGGTQWSELTTQDRFRHLSAAGDLTLPGLLALPERPTVGATPAFDDAEYAAAAEEALRSRADRAEPGTWDATPQKRRRRAVAAGETLLRVAVAAMPVRRDPDAVVPPPE